MSRFDDINPGFAGDPLEIFVAVRTLVDKPRWHADALCREHPSLPWVSDKTSPEVLEQMRSICTRCSVRDECDADVALHGFTTFGVWGGLSAAERRKAKRQAA